MLMEGDERWERLSGVLAPNCQYPDDLQVCMSLSAPTEEAMNILNECLEVRKAG